MAFAAVYVHVPFCVKRCNYCDFVSFAGAERERFAEVYPRLIRQELQLTPAGEETIETVYFGGGTPVVLPPAALNGILTDIRSRFRLTPTAEITVEANPGLLTAQTLAELRAAGFNRLSLGGQSFQDQELAAMGRIHRAADIARSVELARAAGFENIGVDLIYGLPAQTLAVWQDNLRQAAALPVQHISLYGLQLDNDSSWGRLLAAGRLDVPDDDRQADMLLTAMQELPRLGFRRYEIANFCRIDPDNDWSSRHNTAYWRRRDYLGLGCGAASCLGRRRWVNTGDIAVYAAALQDGSLPPRTAEELTAEQVISERLFLGLRLSAGLDPAACRRDFGFDPEEHFAPAIKKLVAAGLLEHQPGVCLRLTEKGVALGNQVFAEFLL